MNPVLEEGLYWAVQDMVSMLMVNKANGSEEEKAEVRRLAAENMTSKLTETGIITPLGDAEKELFITTIIDIATAMSGAVTD